MLTKPLVWSYSFLSTYLRCKLQAEARYVTKTYPYKEIPEMRHGNLVHKAFEDFLKGKSKSFPDEIKQHLKYAEKANSMSGLKCAEHEMGVTRDWKQTAFRASDVWGRCKLDFYVISGVNAVILDWKTGKVWEDPFELEIQALFLKIHYPAIQNIAGMYVWLKEGKFGQPYNLAPGVYDTQKKIENWMNEIDKTRWEPTKNALCGWCDYPHCRFYKETRRTK